MPGPKLRQDQSRLGETSTKVGATSYSFHGAPSEDYMLITALTVVPATKSEAGNWSATMTGFNQSQTMTPSWTATGASGSPVVVSKVGGAG